MTSMSSDDSPRALIQHLASDPSDYTRGCAALALGQAKAKRALGQLLQSLSDPSPWVRGWSAYALGQLQEPDALPHICRALGDQDAWVCQQAAAAMMRFDSRLADTALLDSLKQRETTARVWTLHVMAGRGRPESALDVVPILEDESRSVRLSAIRALYRLGQTEAIAPVRMFMRDNSEHLRGAAAYALGALGDRESVPALSLALTDSKAWVRRNAAWSLLEMGEALNLVASMTKDEDEGVRLFASNARMRLDGKTTDEAPLTDHDAWLFTRDKAV